MKQPSDLSPPGLVRLPVTGVRPEVLDALRALSQTTGISAAWLIRSVLEQHLAGLGLLSSADDDPPTKRREPNA